MSDLFDAPNRWRTSEVTQEELDDCYGGCSARMCDCELGHNGLGMVIRECDCDERREQARQAGGVNGRAKGMRRRSWPLDEDVCTGMDIPEAWTSDDAAYWTGTPRYQPWKDCAAFFASPAERRATYDSPMDMKVQLRARLRDFAGEMWPPLRILLAMIGLARVLAGLL